MFTRINYFERSSIEEAIRGLNQDVTGFEHFLVMIPENPANLYFNMVACDELLDAITATISEPPFIFVGMTMVLVGTYEKADAMQIKLTFS